MREPGVPRTMIRATRYGSGSTRLKPSSCDSTAGSPSMTADSLLESVQELTFDESRALSQTATPKIHSTELLRCQHPCGCWELCSGGRINAAASKHGSSTNLPTPRSRSYHRVRDRVDLTPNVVISILSRASRLVMLRLRLNLEYLIRELALLFRPPLHQFSFLTLLHQSDTVNHFN